MTVLVLHLLWARRTEALTLALLAVFATATAIAAPAALSAVDNKIVREAVGAAPTSQRGISLYSAGSAQDGTREFERFAPEVLQPTGFRLVYMTQMTILDVDRSRSAPVLLNLRHRDDVCAHVTIVAGRCLMGTFEVVLAEETARRLGLRPGSILNADEVIRPEQGGVTRPAGNPRQLMVVGIYRITEPGQDYWAEPAEFQPSADVVDEPVLASRLTLSYSSSTIQQHALVALLPAGHLRAENLDEVEAGVGRVQTAVSSSASGTVVKFHSDLPALIAQIRANIATAREMAPLALAPLIALIFYVIYQAAGSSAEKQREEIALLGLRGATRAQRWWLAAGQAAVIVVVGVPVGFVVAQPINAVIRRLLADTALADTALADTALADTALADTALGSRPNPLTVGSVAVTLLGAAVVATLAHASVTRRPLRELLRRVPPSGRGARGATVEILVALLALLTLVQLRTGGSLAGLAALVPGMVALSLALIVARTVRPVAAALARLALRRGHLGASLATAHLARRPGSHRLVVLVSIAVALFGFCVASLDVAQRARHDRAMVDTGATAVVRLKPLDPRRLLATVRGVDPAGEYAMAVVSAPSSAPVLAVDATRLATGATWRSDFDADPAALGRLLHPPAPASFVLRADEATAEVEDDLGVDADQRSLMASFEPLAGGPGLDVSTGPLRPGRHTYRLSVPGCADGCRLSGFRFVTTGDPTRPLRSTLRSMSAAGSDFVAPADVADQARWLGLNDTDVEAGSAGLVVTGTPSARDSIRVAVLDAPYPLPVVVTASRSGPSDRVTGFDQGLWSAATVARPRLVPRLGGDAVLVDLEYLDRITPGTSVMPGAEVWLGPRAPADAFERLRSAGLPVVDMYTAAQAQRQLANEGPALARWLSLATAAVGILLALIGTFLVVSADGPRLAQDLRQLRRQGLSRRDVRRAASGGIVVVVLAGCLVGLGVSWLVWTLAGDSVPLWMDDRGVPTPPAGPSASVVGPAWLAATALLVGASAWLAGRTRRLIPETREG